MVNRRSASWVARILLAATTVAGFSTGAGSARAATTAAVPVQVALATAGADDPISTDVPVETVNPFLPEERDLTDCVGTVERPGCGSESRGGLHQDLVAIAMIAGLGIVFGRIAWGVRRGQQRAKTDAP